VTVPLGSSVTRPPSRRGNRTNQLWARVDREIVNHAPVVPLFTLKNADIVSERVGNYQYNPQWGVLIDQLWVR